MGADETENFMPLALDISHKILIEMSKIRRENKEMTYLKIDKLVKNTIRKIDIKLLKQFFFALTLILFCRMLIYLIL